MNILSIPPEVIRYFFEFLTVDERVKYLHCCKYLKRLNLDTGSIPLKMDYCYAGMLAKLNQLGILPSQQLSLCLEGAVVTSATVPFILESGSSLFELKCNQYQFFRILTSLETLQVRHLSVKLNRNTPSQAFNGGEPFSKIVNCEALSLSFPSSNDQYSVPYLPSVARLSLRETCLLSEPLVLTMYSSHLNYLCLEGCKIIDVTMLGCIPHLELKDCKELVDISSLNDNDIIRVVGCDSIRDYSRSFANSRKIEVVLTTPRSVLHRFNVTRWSRVQHLKLCSNNNRKPMFKGKGKLPKTVKRCELAGGFVASLLTITSDHRIEQIKIAKHSTIASLEGRGLEQVSVVELDTLASLQSLQGLGIGVEEGRGRNRKITVNKCDAITDFSPLNRVPVVEIHECDGFTDPLQVRFVRYLSVRLNGHRSISFVADTTLSNPFESIYSLTLLGPARSFDGLERIPYLDLSGTNYGFEIARFLQTGKRFHSQRIALPDTPCSERLLMLHHQFMEDQYVLKSRWPLIWIRK